MQRQPYSFPGTASAAISWPEAAFLWRGRLGRGRYFMFSLANSLIVCALLITGIYLTRHKVSLPGLILVIGGVGLGFWGSIALAAKRFRDLDFPGWIAIPVIVMTDASGPMMPRLHEWGPVVLLCVGVIGVCLTFVKGTRGPNRYGRTSDSRV